MIASSVIPPMRIFAVGRENLDRFEFRGNFVDVHYEFSRRRLRNLYREEIESWMGKDSENF